MKKLRLPLLTALLTLALVGLVGLQFYWTNMAYQIARQRFKQSAHEALQTVAQKLEQREIIYATQRSASKLQDSLRIWEAQRQAYEEARMAQLRALEAEKRTSQPKVTPPSPPKNNITINLGSISKKQRLLEDNREIQGYVVFSPDERQKFVFSTGYVNIKQGFDSIQTNFHTKQVNSYYFSELQELKALNDKYEAKSKEVIVNCAPFEIPPAPKKPATPVKQASHITTNMATALPQSEKKFIKIESKEDVLKFLVQEIRQAKPALDKRISKRLLDSMLRWEFAQRGIYLPYRFGIEVLPRREVLPTHNPIYTSKQVCQDIAQLTDLNSYEKPHYLYFPVRENKRKILDSEFNTQLFPTEIVGNRNTLFVYFPQEVNWLWREMALTGGASLLFIALIIGCFAYALYTIWRQKKISEITHDFINNMTHEFKTPVATVALACEALQDPDMRQIPSFTDRYLQIIKEENERLGRQVERVLQIAMLDRTDFRLKIQPCDLHDMVQKATHKISLQVESRQGTMHTSLEASETCLQADEVHLTNVMLNLLDNAVKYSPEAPQITLTTRSTTEGVWLTIADKGQGMTKEAQAKIFDKFYRVSTGNVHTVKGFGLGLSYVRTIVQAHHGRVSVQSEVGKGSIFSVFLPYAQPEA